MDRYRTDFPRLPHFTTVFPIFQLTKCELYKQFIVASTENTLMGVVPGTHSEALQPLGGDKIEAVASFTEGLLYF